MCFLFLTKHIVSTNKIMGVITKTSTFYDLVFWYILCHLIINVYFILFFIPIVNNSVLFTSYFYIFVLVVVFVFSHSSIPI